MRRVGVMVTRSVPVIVALAVGAGFVRSTVGVTVGGSRVGIGACVGVASRMPPGKLRKVGCAGGSVITGASVLRGIIVGVGAR